VKNLTLLVAALEVLVGVGAGAALTLTSDS
jgi:hypothetical protein